MTLHKLLIATLAIVAAPACWCGTVQFSNSNIQAATGSTFSVDVLAGGVFDLYAFQFDLAWNPALLTVQSVTEGGFLPLAGPTTFDGGTIDNGAGTVSLTFDTLNGAIPGASGDGVLLSVSFTALAEGTSTLQFLNVLALDSSFNDIGAAFTDSTISIATPAGVPEPATYFLVLAALAVQAIRLRSPNEL